MVEVSVKRFFVVSPQKIWMTDCHPYENDKVNQHVILMLMIWFFLMLFGDGYD